MAEIPFPQKSTHLLIITLYNKCEYKFKDKNNIYSWLIHKIHTLSFSPISTIFFNKFYLRITNNVSNSFYTEELI